MTDSASVMRWNRFALGMLPAVPVVIVSVVVLAMGGPEHETDETGPTTARVELDRPKLRTPSTARPRAIPRPRTTTQVKTPMRPDGAEAAPPSSKVARCCAELKRYRRATSQKFRELYDGVISTCSDVGDVVVEGDEEPMLDKLRGALKEKNAPYIPPACR